MSKQKLTITTNSRLREIIGQLMTNMEENESSDYCGFVIYLDNFSGHSIMKLSIRLTELESEPARS